MIWCTISKKYIDYLKKYDSRIPDVDYGTDKYKPFFSPLFEKNGLIYVSQVSSKKERHLKMKESIDFIKIFDKENKNLLAVVNLNYMFPVPKNEIIEVKYKEIDNFRTFKDFGQKTKYIKLLQYQMKVIENKNIEKLALTVYKDVNTNFFLKNRSLPFTLLEEKALEYLKIKGREKIEAIKDIIKNNGKDQYNCLTGNQINIPERENKENRWIYSKAIENEDIKLKEGAQATEALLCNINKDGKLETKIVKYYNLSDIVMTKELEQKLIPMKEKVVEKIKDRGIER